MATATKTQTATRTQTRTREQWERRALELAQTKHLDGTARVLCQDAYRVVYGVRRSWPIGAEWVVLVTPRSGRVVCDCLAGLHDRPCCHAGAALHAERQRLEAHRRSSARSEAWQWWLHGGEWE